MRDSDARFNVHKATFWKAATFRVRRVYRVNVPCERLCSRRERRCQSLLAEVNALPASASSPLPDAHSRGKLIVYYLPVHPSGRSRQV